jgi:hypothetical protein
MGMVMVKNEVNGSCWLIVLLSGSINTGWALKTAKPMICSALTKWKFMIEKGVK